MYRCGAVVPGSDHTAVQVNPQELAQLPASLLDRDDAVRNGLTLCGQRYEVRATEVHRSPAATLQVHRHHPPVVYGRTMHGPVENTEGIALVAGKHSAARPTWYAVVTYEYVGGIHTSDHHHPYHQDATRVGAGGAQAP